MIIREGSKSLWSIKARITSNRPSLKVEKTGVEKATRNGKKPEVDGAVVIGLVLNESLSL